MSFGKKQETKTRDDFDLGNENDKRVIREFEAELKPYMDKELTLFPGTRFERVLRGFDLYLHEKGFYRYSGMYPLGAVGDHEAYSFALQKKRGLDRLMDRRRWAEANEAHRVEQIQESV